MPRGRFLSDSQQLLVLFGMMLLILNFDAAVSICNHVFHPDEIDMPRAFKSEQLAKKKAAAAPYWTERQQLYQQLWANIDDEDANPEIVAKENAQVRMTLDQIERLEEKHATNMKQLDKKHRSEWEVARLKLEVARQAEFIRLLRSRAASLMLTVAFMAFFWLKSRKAEMRLRPLEEPT